MTAKTFFTNAVLPTILEHEGGYANDPADAGGETNYGISLRYLRNLPRSVADINEDGTVDGADIRALTPAKAGALYWREYQAQGLARWIGASPTAGMAVLAVKHFDTAVNTGPRQAALFLQRAVNAAAQRPALVDDGAIGPKTRAAVRTLEDEHQLSYLLSAYRALQADFYRSIATGARKKFLGGWLARAYS